MELGRFFWAGFFIGLFIGANLGLFTFCILFKKPGSGRRCTDEEYIPECKEDDKC